jgi:hypothetical protein
MIQALRVLSVSYQLFCSGGERGVGVWTPAHYGTPWKVCRYMYEVYDYDLCFIIV